MARSGPHEGRIAIVTDVGVGMRWTRQRRARAVTQGGSSLRVVSGQPARRRTALLPSSPMLRRMGTKPGEAAWRRRVAYGEAVWSWHPLLVSSRRRRGRTQPGSIRHRSADDGGKTNSSPGRARSKPFKPLRREGRTVSAEPVVTPPVHFFRTGDRGCGERPVFPAPSVFRGAPDGITPGAIGAAGRRSHICCLEVDRNFGFRRIFPVE